MVILAGLDAEARSGLWDVRVRTNGTFDALFDVTSRPRQPQRYFDIAAELQPALDRIDGFVTVERFQTLSRPDVYLSLSYWRNEAAISAWRNQAYHREGQREGRATVFSDYRIRVVSVERDYSFQDRAEAPLDSNSVLL